MWLLRALSRLPFPVLYALADGLAWLAHYGLRYRRRVVLDNLRRAFPAASEAERHTLARRFYRNLADVLVETLKGLTISEAALLRRLTFVDHAQMTALAQRGQPFLVLTSHQCNWEWILLGASAFMPFPVHAVYRPLKNDRADALMRGFRSRFGATLVPNPRWPRHVLQHADRGRSFAIVGDQTPSARASYWRTFLHQDTPFYAGTERLAQRLACPVFFADMRRQRRGHYEVRVRLLAQPPYADHEHPVLDAYAQAIEATIRQAPADWLWSHRRWKHQRPSDTASDGRLGGATTATQKV